MNSISFDGRLAADAELRYTQAGDPILSFRVASDIGFGERKSTNWFQCQVWGKRAESLQPYLTKGQQVTVYGALNLREWEDKDGGKRLSPDVRVNDLALQGGKREDGQDSPPARQSRQEPPPPRRQAAQEAQHRQPPRNAPPAYNDGLSDDIPFGRLGIDNRLCIHAL